jgi:hypothetical protein
LHPQFDWIAVVLDTAKLDPLEPEFGGESSRPMVIVDEQSYLREPAFDLRRRWAKDRCVCGQLLGTSVGDEHGPLQTRDQEWLPVEIDD